MNSAAIDWFLSDLQTFYSEPLVGGLMLLLGLHFGHDAAVCILKDGKLASYVMRERHKRVKHAMTLDVSVLDDLFSDAGVSIEDIDHVAITSTQRKELVFDDGERMRVTFDRHPQHAGPSTLTSPEKARANIQNDLLDYLYDASYKGTPPYEAYSRFFPEFKSRDRSAWPVVDWIDIYEMAEEWCNPTPLKEIAEHGFDKFLNTDRYRHGFHLPVTFTFDGVRKPAYFVHHHMCHAASTYFLSGYEQAAVITHDGHSRPANYNAGMMFYARENKVYPIASNYLFLGALYDHVGQRLGLGIIGPAGKLMGQGPWGRPNMFDRKFAGNWGDFKKNVNPDGDYRRAWMDHCEQFARANGYDMDKLGKREHATAPVNADIAASTQLLFEESMLMAADCVHKGLKKSELEVSNLCVSGGTALNCPSNSRLWREGPFDNVFVEPGCDDSGIAVGAALHIYHNVLDYPAASLSDGTHFSPYCGVRRSSEERDAALDDYREQIAVLRDADAVAHSAEMLANDNVVAWFEGRSEIGPRALGHRSLLADPRQKKNWERVNDIKGREPWRPFAPAVLADEAHKWFEGCPMPSPYMLFTATVTSDLLPAITHKDNSSRIQTVTKECGEFFRLLSLFYTNTRVPVVLNTSLNGPGVPIIEHHAEAIEFLIERNVDALYLDGVLCVRKADKAKLGA